MDSDLVSILLGLQFNLGAECTEDFENLHQLIRVIVGKRPYWAVLLQAYSTLNNALITVTWCRLQKLICKIHQVLYGPDQFS